MPSSDDSSCCPSTIDCNLAKKVEKIWKKAFCDATLLTCASSKKAQLYTHTMGGPPLRINGLISSSPLANNAFYTWECAPCCSDKSKREYLNLYEVMLPDIPGKCGKPSTVEIYTRLLENYGYKIRVNGKHYHWEGAKLIPEATAVVAIHHSGPGIDPVKFSKRTICALEKVMCVIAKRSKHH